jgi:cell division protein FtsX
MRDSLPNLKLLVRLWRDNTGSVLTAEVVMLSTVLIIGIIVGAKSLRDAWVTEWADYAQAIANLDQSYNIPNATAPLGLGSGFVDARDYCDTSTDVDTPNVLSTNDEFDDPPTSFIRYSIPPTGE